MPTLSEMAYGGSSTEVENFATALSTAIGTVSTAINDISQVTTAVNANWVGKSKDKFLEALATDAQNVDTLIASFFNTLGTEFTNVMSVMQQHDLEMFKE